jgi:hypothetical protein
MDFSHAERCFSFSQLKTLALGITRCALSAWRCCLSSPIARTTRAEFGVHKALRAVPPGRRGEKTTTPGRRGSCGSSARRATSMPATSDCQTRRTRLPGGNRRRLVTVAAPMATIPARRSPGFTPASVTHNARNAPSPPGHHHRWTEDLRHHSDRSFREFGPCCRRLRDCGGAARQGGGAGAGRECALAMGAVAHGQRLLSRHGCLLHGRRRQPEDPGHRPEHQFLNGGSHKSLIVATNDGLIAVVAPGDDGQSRIVVGLAEQKYPGKPWKYLLSITSADCAPSRLWGRPSSSARATAPSAARCCRRRRRSIPTGDQAGAAENRGSRRQVERHRGRPHHRSLQRLREKFLGRR